MNYYFILVLWDGTRTLWNNLSEKKAKSMYKWANEHMILDNVKSFEWGIHERSGKEG